MPIDFSDYLKEEQTQIPEEEPLPEKEEEKKKSRNIFQKIKAFWLTSDEKTRKELLVLVLIVLVTLAVLIFGILHSRGGNEYLLTPPPAEY